MRAAIPFFVMTTAWLAGCGGGGSWFDEPFWQDTDIVVADMDGDGRADILTLGSYWEHGNQLLGRIAVYRQIGAGVFAAPEAAAAGVNSWRIALGDLDGDRFLDIVVTYPEERRIGVRRQDPARPGSFLGEQRIALAGPPYGAAIADFDGDGRGDIAVGNNGGTAGIFLLLQDPAAPLSFGPPAVLAQGASVEFLVAGDFDGDLRADLAFGASEVGPGPLEVETRIGLLLQQAGGGFGAPSYLAPVADRYVKGLHAADADGDGAMDIVAVYGAPAGGGACLVSVFLQADGFYAPVSTEASDSFVASFVADIDANGLPDLCLGRWPGASAVDIYVDAGGAAPLVPGPTLQVLAQGFSGHAAAGRLAGGALADVAVVAGGFVFIARQQSPGSFAPFQPLP